MKKLFTIILALMSLFVFMQTTSALIYNVTVPVGTEACFISGTMNNWSTPLVNRMTKVDATHFTLDIPTALETDSFKYYSGPDWKYEERDANNLPLVKNRGYKTADVVANWAAVYLTGYAKTVTIDVLVPLTTIECFIVGTFNNWASPAAPYQMTKGASTTEGIDFSIVINTLDTTTFQFKFCAGPAWSYQQTNTTNFSYMNDGAAVVVTAFDAIYDPTKVGTINITATVPDNPFEVWIMGDFLGWDMTKAVLGTKVNATTWTFSIPLVQSIQYRLYNHNDWGYAEVGQADPTADLPNRLASYPTDANTAITVYAWKQAFVQGLQNIYGVNYKIYSLNKNVVVEGVTSQVEIIDLYGRRIQSQKLIGTFKSNNLQSGIYLIRVDGFTIKVAVN